jgi:hypothetical protein
MATPQNRINRFAAPNLIDLLKRKRDEEAMSDGRPAIDIARIRPPFDNPDPQPAALSQPIIRMADSAAPSAPSLSARPFQNDIQPTNNLSSPPNVTATNAQMPSADQIQTAPIINKRMFDAPVASNTETLPRIAANPVATLSNDYRNQPLETDTAINEAKPLTRPIQPYNTVPSSFGGNAIPIDAPVLSASRERTTQSIDPMIRAAENYNASMSAPPDFGQEKVINPATRKVEIDPETGKPITQQRTHGREGVVGRIESFLKGAWDNYSHGGSAISALVSGGESAANTNRNATIRLQRQQAENANQYGNQIQLAGEQAKINQIRANTDLANQRPGLEQQRIAQSGQRIEQGNQRLSQSQINSERQTVRATLATKPTLDATRDAELIARARKAGIDVDPANYKGGRPMFIEGVLSDPYTGSPILRDGKQVVDRTKIPVEYDGLTVTPGQAVSARAAAAGQVATQRRFETSQTNEDRRITEREDRTDKRQQYGDNRRQWEEASKAVSGLDALYRQADRARARANDPNNTRAATDAQTAQDLEADIQAEEGRIHRVYGSQFEEVEVPNDSLWGGETRKQLKLKAAPSMQTAPPTSQAAPRSKTLQRMDSSSMDNQVKSHFDKGGKAIKVRDVKTGKETLVDNYNDYLVAIGRK